MEFLNLALPDQFVEPGQFGLDANPASIKKWLTELPLANVEQSSDEVIALLHEMNQARYLPQQRYQHLAVIQPVLQRLLDTLRTHYSTALLPLSEKNQLKHRFALALNNELACGYRIIVRQLRKQSEREPLNKQDTQLFITTIYLAIQHLSEMLCDYYLVYAPVAPHLWGEINALYVLAEQQQVVNAPVPHSNEDKVCLNIGLIYKCTLLLALCSPYHLMHGEVTQLKRILCKVSDQCDINGTHERPVCNDCANSDCENCYVVDTTRDAAPRFNPGKLSVDMGHSQRVDIHKVIVWFESLYRKVKEPTLAEGIAGEYHLKLSDRIYRDMIKRTLDTIQRNQDREHKRNAILGKISLTIGLSATHYHISDEAPFRPELDEIHLHTGQSANDRHEFSLVPIDMEPWKEEEEEARIDQGIVATPRESHFDDDASVLDMWNKVYANQRTFIDQHSHEHEMKKHHVNSSWTQKNISVGGMCIFCQPESTLPVRVGELVSYYKKENDPWTLGVIRWLKVHENQILEIGIMHMVTEAWSCAARSIKGTGKGCEYFRCLVTEREFDSDNASIIAPTAVFDVGSKLVVNFENRIHYVLLDEPMLTTKSFTRFRIKSIDRPDIETENIDRLRRLL